MTDDGQHSGDTSSPLLNEIPPVAPPLELKPEPATYSHKLLIILGAVVVLLAVAVAAWFVGHNTASRAIVTNTAKKTSTGQTTASTTEGSVQGLQLDSAKNYGNKYADGILPVGDGKYSTTTAKTGYIYACNQYAQNLTTGQGGAGVRGPWFTDNNTEYNVNEKDHVEGSVMWQADFTENTANGLRTIVTNDLPSHPTGIFPIISTDPAYAYDRNPNSIKAQNLTYALPDSPTYGNPNCMGGEAGIMLTGVALFNAFDAGGRDAGAWEVQDNCDGHPQMDGIYHYHTLSSCIKDISVHTVIGFALDGFPITGPEVGPDNFLTTDDLDVCHGITSQIELDNKSVTMYHYVMTQDFPYSVSCFRGSAIQPPDLAHAPGPQ
jgi:YHYH protein